MHSNCVVGYLSAECGVILMRFSVIINDGLKVDLYATVVKVVMYMQVS